MSEEMKNEMELENAEAVETAAEPVETMEDYAAELEASYKTLNKRNIEISEDESGVLEKWAHFTQMLEERTVFSVKIAEAVKAGVVAYVDDVRAFIPASQLSTEDVEKLAQFKAGDVVEGTVDSLKNYGAFIKLADGVDGLLHVSQISTQRIKHPGVVLKEGQSVKVKILSVADGKISLSMKALTAPVEDEEQHERFDYKETASVTTGLGDLLKGLKL